MSYSYQTLSTASLGLDDMEPRLPLLLLVDDRRGRRNEPGDDGDTGEMSEDPSNTLELADGVRVGVVLRTIEEGRGRRERLGEESRRGVVADVSLTSGGCAETLGAVEGRAAAVLEKRGGMKCAVVAWAVSGGVDSEVDVGRLLDSQ